MKHLVPTFLLGAFMMVGTHPAAQGTDRLDTLRITWLVSDYRILDRGMATDQEARALLSRPLSVDDVSISFDGKSCVDVSFQRHAVDLRAYLRSHFNLSPEDLGITSPAGQLVRTSCDLAGFSEYLQVPARKILVFRDGICLIFSPRIF